MKRYYEILGVGRDTTLDEVRQAYRDLVRVWHPDRFSSDYRLSRISEEKLKSINEAYREVRAHIERSPPPEQGVLFEERRPADPSASPGDSEYMFDFYDPDYSPWIWTYQRERSSGPTAGSARIRFRRAIILAAAIFILGLSGAAAWHFGLAPAAPHATTSPPLPTPPETAPVVSPAPSPPASPGAASTAGNIEETVLHGEASAIEYGVHKGRSRVTLENNTGDDAVVKLVLVETTESRRIRSVFLPGGKTFTVTEVPPGRYLVKVALGTGWISRTMRFRRPAGFAVSTGVEVEEEATDRPRSDGIVVRQLVASELRVPLDRLIGTRITEAEFLAD